MTPEQLKQITGEHQLFLGIPTYSWSLAQFQEAARFAKAHGVDTLLVKTNEGALPAWYDGIGGWKAVKRVIQNEGVGAIPYIFSYGNKFGDLDIEIDTMLSYMQNDGVVCMNAEDAWNGQIQWAQHLCGRMQGVPGTFLVSTWADPSLQDWLGVIAALAPCTTAFMPQIYNNFLALPQFWPEFGANGAQWLQPTVNLTQDFGPNDPVAIARDAAGQGHTAISVWYYDTAVANPELLDAVYDAFPKGEQSMIPQGWTDDGSTLTAPNGHKVVLGFRNYILANNWDPNNVPLEEEYRTDPVEDYYDQPGANSGQRQMFLYCELIWTPQRGVYQPGIGVELLGCRHDRDVLKASLVAAQAEIDNNPAVAKVHAFKQALSDLASV